MKKRSPRFYLPSGAQFHDLPLIAEALKRFGPNAKVRDLVKVKP